MLRAAHFNTELIPQEMIYVDLCTDSGVSALSAAQLAALTTRSEPGMGLAIEGNRSFAHLTREAQHVAEAILHADAHRDEIRRFERIEDPTRAQYDPARFTRL